MCKRFFVSKDRLAQAAEVIITQNRLEAKVKLWQGKFCSPTHSAIPVAPGAQINTPRHEDFALKFSLVANKEKKSLKHVLSLPV